MKSRLVIHMDDRSTDFLRPIYQGTKGTIVTRSLPSSLINDLIRSHEQVIMLGHGCPAGLFADRGGLVISNENVQALSEKSDSIFIWCHASSFMSRYNLRGFATGMFVSEPGEARIYALDTDPDKIDRSNDMFANLVSAFRDDPIPLLYEKVYNGYDMNGESAVVDYNRSLLTFKQEKQVAKDRRSSHNIGTLRSSYETISNDREADKGP